jgi:micrococcal nuclease
MYLYKAHLQRVVDGDTLDVNVDLGFTAHVVVRLRLYGVDTPEIHGVAHDSAEYKAGMAATEHVTEWFADSYECYIRTKKTGKYGRWLAMVWKNEDDVDKTELSLNADLVSSGHATPYTK